MAKERLEIVSGKWAKLCYWSENEESGRMRCTTDYPKEYNLEWIYVNTWPLDEEIEEEEVSVYIYK